MAPGAREVASALERMHHVGEVDVLYVLHARRNPIEIESELLRDSLQAHLAALELASLTGPEPVVIVAPDWEPAASRCARSRPKRRTPRDPEHTLHLLERRLRVVWDAGEHGVRLVAASPLAAEENMKLPVGGQAKWAVDPCSAPAWQLRCER